MNRGRVIGLVAGGVVAAAVLLVGLVLLYFGGLVPEQDRLIVASIALAPLVLVAVMVGYAVWWGVVFLFALFSSAGASDRIDGGVHSDVESRR